MKTLSTLVLFFSFIALVKSQGTTKQAIDTGKVTIVQDARVDLLLSKKTEVNKKTNGKSAGYRVQIHFGSDSQEAKKIKADFMTAYPNVPSYFIYDAPNFKVRVGDFKTKLDAQRFLKEIKNTFPASFVVDDKVEPMKLE